MNDKIFPSCRKKNTHTLDTEGDKRLKELLLAAYEQK